MSCNGLETRQDKVLCTQSQSSVLITDQAGGFEKPISKALGNGAMMAERGGSERRDRRRGDIRQARDADEEQRSSPSPAQGAMLES